MTTLTELEAAIEYDPRCGVDPLRVARLTSEMRSRPSQDREHRDHAPERRDSNHQNVT